MALLFGEELLCGERAAAQEVSINIWCPYHSLLKLSADSSTRGYQNSTLQFAKKCT